MPCRAHMRNRLTEMKTNNNNMIFCKGLIVRRVARINVVAYYESETL